MRRRWKGGQWGSWRRGGGDQWRGERGRDGEEGKKGPEERRFHRWI